MGGAPTGRATAVPTQGMLWLAAACVQLHEACKAHAGHLLATRSTEGRLERVIAQQKAAVAKKYGGTRRKPK